MKRAHVLVAGLVLLALTNAVALGGALWNRSGEPEARMRLSERELHRAGSWYGSHENSGLSLGVGWRTFVEERGDAETPIYGFRYGFSGRSPRWLDAAKMQALGFDTSLPAPYSDRARTRYEKQLPREVFLALEFDGPAYRYALAVTNDRVARELARPIAEGDKAGEERRKNARESLDWETLRSSRLFVVDAALDAAALREKYPDRARYAIVRGEVRPQASGTGAGQATGYVAGVSVPSINVPLRLRPVFVDAATFEYGPRTPFAATVAWGRRLEPWLIEAARK
jgi:hypothetical protein